MKKMIITTAIGILAALPLALITESAWAEGRVQRDGEARVGGNVGDNNGDNNGVGAGVQDGVEHPAAVVHEHRENVGDADDDGDGILNRDDPDDNNNGVPDDQEGASSDVGAEEDQ